MQKLAKAKKNVVCLIHVYLMVLQAIQCQMKFLMHWCEIEQNYVHTHTELKRAPAAYLLSTWYTQNTFWAHWHFTSHTKRINLK